MKEIYFDNAATTQLSQELHSIFQEIAIEFYANPSSLHEKGLLVEKQIIKTKKLIANYLNISDRELYFTSGGTESNNLAVFGLNNKNIISSLNQHPSITEPIKILKNKSDIKYLKVIDGKIQLDDLEKSINEKTNLVCLTHVNNETGIINDLEKIIGIIKNKNPNTLVHVDGVQGFGKLNLDLNKLKIDSYSFSSHKIHGQKGVGGLFVRDNVNLRPMFYGGLQQNKLRPGTENTIAIIMLENTVKIAIDELENNYNKISELRNYFLEKVKVIDNIVVNGEIGKTSPYILNISFLGTKGEIVLNALSNKGIFVSTGSACSGKGISENLLNHNYNKEIPDTAIRFSFSKYNTKEEIDTCISVLKKEVNIIRKVMSKR